MEYRYLGRTGLQVSPICLGTMNFGVTADEPDSMRIMDKALDEGINFFDCADVYGARFGQGYTEEILGRWFKQGGRRERIVLATKCYNPMGTGPNNSRLSAYHIRRACEASLKRLNTDHIDLYQMHHIDRNTPWEEIWQAMDLLIKQGKITYVGSSNFAGWHIAQAQGEARCRNMMGLVCEQTKYNLLNRVPELEVIPACKEFGLGFIAWSPLAEGLLAGDVDSAKKGYRRDEERQRKSYALHDSALKRFYQMAEELGHKPAQVALAWLLSLEGVTGPIIGPRTMQQFEKSMEALAIRLSDSEMARLDEIFPGPGGAAPEAYAW